MMYVGRREGEKDLVGIEEVLMLEVSVHKALDA
jgi:hypothetical protein